jgi:hypothetical protein
VHTAHQLTPPLTPPPPSHGGHLSNIPVGGSLRVGGTLGEALHPHAMEALHDSVAVALAAGVVAAAGVHDGWLQAAAGAASSPYGIVADRARGALTSFVAQASGVAVQDITLPSVAGVFNRASRASFAALSVSTDAHSGTNVGVDASRGAWADACRQLLEGGLAPVTTEAAGLYWVPRILGYIVLGLVARDAGESVTATALIGPQRERHGRVVAALQRFARGAAPSPAAAPPASPAAEAAATVGSKRPSRVTGDFAIGAGAGASSPPLNVTVTYRQINHGGPWHVDGVAISAAAALPTPGSLAQGGVFPLVSDGLSAYARVQSVLAAQEGCTPPPGAAAWAFPPRGKGGATVGEPERSRLAVSDVLSLQRFVLAASARKHESGGGGVGGAGGGHSSRRTAERLHTLLGAADESDALHALGCAVDEVTQRVARGSEGRAASSLERVAIVEAVVAVACFSRGAPRLRLVPALRADGGCAFFDACADLLRGHLGACVRGSPSGAPAAAGSRAGGMAALLPPALEEVVVPVSSPPPPLNAHAPGAGRGWRGPGVGGSRRCAARRCRMVASGQLRGAT